MEDIKILDDFLPKNIQDKIEFFCLSEGIQYTYFNSTLKNVENEDYLDAEQFVNVFIHNGEFIKDDFSHYFLLPLIIGSIELNLNLQLKNIIRAKNNMTLKQPEISKEFINPPHIDQELSKGIDLTAIYYVNESDGDTILYEGGTYNDLVPIKKVSPKKGRLLLMDGNRFHSSSHPTKTNKRLVINYNLKSY